MHAMHVWFTYMHLHLCRRFFNLSSRAVSTRVPFLLCILPLVFHGAGAGGPKAIPFSRGLSKARGRKDIVYRLLAAVIEPDELGLDGLVFAAGVKDLAIAIQVREHHEGKADYVVGAVVALALTWTSVAWRAAA